MRIDSSSINRPSIISHRQNGVSLIEMVVFLVVVAIASTALFKVYNFSLMKQVDPIVQVRATELAQAKLDEVLALKYDESTPTGGIPACSNGGIAPGGSESVACTNNPESNMNDVDDYNGATDTPVTGYTRSVKVVTSGNLKLVTVTVAGPKSLTLQLAAYRANF